METDFSLNFLAIISRHTDLKTKKIQSNPRRMKTKTKFKASNKLLTAKEKGMRKTIEKITEGWQEKRRSKMK